MDLRLDGKTSLVTGGSKGIGLAVGRRFAEAGANVMLAARKADALADAAAELEGLDGPVAWHVANAGDPSRRPRASRPPSTGSAASTSSSTTRRRTRTSAR